jgi:hypothetical protein
MALYDGIKGAQVQLFWSAPGAPASITMADGTVLSPVSPANVTVGANVVGGGANSSIWAVPLRYMSDVNLRAQVDVSLFYFQSQNPLPSQSLKSAPNPQSPYWGAPGAGVATSISNCTTATRPSVPAGTFSFNTDTGRLLYQSGGAIGWTDYATSAAT